MAVVGAHAQRWSRRDEVRGREAIEGPCRREPADENRRLKEIVADLTLDNRRREHLSEGNW
jgi:hypothetical protein